MSKAELSRRAKISPATITRIENGMSCRMATQRKIILALGYKKSDRIKIFGEDAELPSKDNQGRRLGIDRRQFKYHMHIPDQRSDKERRKEFDIRLKPRSLKK